MPLAIASAATCVLALVSPALVVDLAEPQPAAVVVAGLKELGGVQSLGDVLELLEQAAAERTRLRFLPIDEVRMDACLRSRSKASPLACEVWTVLETAPRPALVLYVNGRRGPSGAEVRVGALRPATVEGALRGAFDRVNAAPPHSAPGPEDADAATYDALHERLVDALEWGGARGAETRAELEDALQTALEVDLRSALEPAGLLRGAELLITTDPAGAHLDLDGRDLGPVPDEGVRVAGLGTGRHQVEARLPGRRPRRIEVDLQAVDQERLVLQLEEDHGPAWDALGWTGGGVLAAGAALALHGVLEADSVNRGASRGPEGLVRILRDDPRPSLEPTLGEGPTIAGMAVGLGVVGAALVVSSLFVRDPSRPPWLEAALAVGLGLAAFGVVEATAALSP